VNHNARGVLDEIPPELWQMMVDGEDVGGCYRKGCQQHCPHHAADLSHEKNQKSAASSQYDRAAAILKIWSDMTLQASIGEAFMQASKSW
jgi:hypothetical protein